MSRNSAASSEARQHLQAISASSTSYHQLIMMQEIESIPSDHSLGEPRESKSQHCERGQKGVSESKSGVGHNQWESTVEDSSQSQIDMPLSTPAPGTTSSTSSVSTLSWSSQTSNGELSPSIASQYLQDIHADDTLIRQRPSLLVRQRAGSEISQRMLKRREHSKQMVPQSDCDGPMPQKSVSRKLSGSKNIACLSSLSCEFVQGVKALENERELPCPDDYPEAFTGQETVKLLSEITAKVSLTEPELDEIANALLLHRLFKPIGFTETSVIQDTVTNISDDYYFVDEDATHPDLLPRGVLVKLTPCYANGCRPETGCYAPRCPNHSYVFQDKNKDVIEKEKEIINSDDVEPIGFFSVEEREKLEEKEFRRRTWSEKVPKSLLQEIGREELERQEAINEIIYSEEAYLDDLTVLHKLFYLPLLEKDIITNMERRRQFVMDVFNNHIELIDLSNRLFQDLLKIETRYKGKPVDALGQVLMQHFTFFEKPFTTYAKSAYLAAHAFETEIESNPALESYLEEIQPRKEMQRHTWRHFFLRPIFRLGRYQIIIQAIIKNTEETHSDHRNLVRCKDIIESVAQRSDELSDHSKQQVDLIKIHAGLVFKLGDTPDLQLLAPQRRLFFYEDVKRCTSFNDSTPRGELIVMVLDYALVMAKKRKTEAGEEFLLWKRPVPMMALALGDIDHSFPSSTVSSGSSSSTNSSLIVQVYHHGTRGGHYYLLCNDAKQKKDLLDAIALAKMTDVKRRYAMDISKRTKLDAISFQISADARTAGDPGKVNCTAPFTTAQGKSMFAVGTETGVYIKENEGRARHIIGKQNVTRLAVMEQHGILVVLADRILQAYPLEKLLSPTNMKTPERLRHEIDKNVHFFEVGVCNDRDLLLYKKRKNTVSVFKALEPLYDLRNPKHERLLEHKSGLLGRTSHPWFRPYKDFYVGAESSHVHFLRSKLLVVCERGFEIIDPEDLRGSLERDIPNRQDQQFAFLARLSDGLKPLGMYRVQDMFLLCYNKFAFYVDRRGCLVKRQSIESPLLCEWEGVPTHVIVQAPYVIAFDNKCIEIRNVETGELEELIFGDQIQLTYFGGDTPKIHYSEVARTNGGDFQIISQLNLNSARRQSRW